MAGRADEVVLETWGGLKTFSYSGSVKWGTRINYGEKGYSSAVSADKYQALLRHFLGSTVKMGTQRIEVPSGSVGEWLMANIPGRAIASYVGPILVAEGYAEKADGPMIRFKG